MQQVAQHLGEQHLVRAHGGRRRRFLDHQFHLRAGGERPQRAAQLPEHGAQVDFGPVRLDPARLRLGQVEQLVDQPQQVARRGADQPHLAGLLTGERVGGGVGQQPGQADDRGDRGAQLVADVRQEPALRLTRGPQLGGLLVQLGVERHHAAVGLLQLLGELVVERHHAPVGLLEFGVEHRQLVALAAYLVEGADELRVLGGQLVQGRTRGALGQLGTKLGGALRRQLPGMVGHSSGHPDDRIALDGHDPQRVHQTRDGTGLRLVPSTGQRTQRRQVHLQDPAAHAVAVEGERHVRAVDPVQQLPRHLAQRRGDAYLVLVFQPDRRGHLPAALPDQEDVLLHPECEMQEGFGHATPRATRTQASSRRTPASRSRVAAASRGVRPASPG